jgi:adenylyl cyclase-associated protein
MGAVFGELNKGEEITKGLKKVERSEMTHRNPELRGSGQPLSPSSSKGAGGAPPKIPSKPVSMRAKKPAKTALEGNKWMVENHEDEKNIVIDQTELSQTVNIFGCKNCVIQVKGKVNAVSLISCTKTSVLLDTLVSSLSITSSPSFTVQVTGRTPTVLIDTTDSGQLYLSKESLNAEVVTAKCSAINISVPLKGGEEGEFVEHAMPEQLKHVFDEKTGKFRTEIVAHSG